jgi:hypothetical protein
MKQLKDKYDMARKMETQVFQNYKQELVRLSDVQQRKANDRKTKEAIKIALAQDSRSATRLAQKRESLLAQLSEERAQIKNQMRNESKLLEDVNSTSRVLEQAKEKCNKASGSPLQF